MKKFRMILCIMLSLAMLTTVAAVSVNAAEGSQAVSAGELTVNASSNFFDYAYSVVNMSDDRVTVGFQLQSNVKVLNAEWRLEFDYSKLALDSINMPGVASPIYGDPMWGMKTGNFTDPGLVDYSAGQDFVVATFDIIGTGEANVSLDVINLGFAKITGDSISIAYLMDEGILVNIASRSDFSDFTYSANSRVTAGTGFLRGDINQNGSIDIQDATLLQSHLAEMQTLTGVRLLAADVDKDGYIDVRDVTFIQRVVAGIIFFID